jgi:hypothetical protein
VRKLAGLVHDLAQVGNIVCDFNMAFNNSDNPNVLETKELLKDEDEDEAA